MKASEAKNKAISAVGEEIQQINKKINEAVAKGWMSTSFEDLSEAAKEYLRDEGYRVTPATGLYRGKWNVYWDGKTILD